jgi:hypothetical protein
MHPPVKLAVADLETAFAGHAVEAVSDGEGGAFVRLADLSFGEQYEPSAGWVVFRITHAHPSCDIYPHYLPEALRRRDGKPLGEAFHKQEMKLGPFTGNATMISRRSNKWNPALDTAGLKLAKVLDWIRSRP